MVLFHHIFAPTIEHMWGFSSPSDPLSLARTHTHTQTYINTYTRTHIQTQTCTQSHAHKQAQIQQDNRTVNGWCQFDFVFYSFYLGLIRAVRLTDCVKVSTINSVNNWLLKMASTNYLLLMLDRVSWSCFITFSLQTSNIWGVKCWCFAIAWSNLNWFDWIDYIRDFDADMIWAVWWSGVELEPPCESFSLLLPQ